MIPLLNIQHLIVKVYWTLDGSEVYFVGIQPKTHQNNKRDQDYVVKMRKPEILCELKNEDSDRLTLSKKN